MKRHPLLGFALSAGIAALFSALPLTAYSASPTPKGDISVPSSDYPLPEYSNTKFPSITSCDVKSGDTTSSETAASGNSTIDAATSIAKTMKGALEKKDEDSDDEEGDIQQGVGLDTKCGEPTKMNLNDKSAEKLACNKFDDKEFIENLRKDNEGAKKILACQRGVLAAINGELSCFKKQITQAQSYMNELINNPGGLNAMLTAGIAQMGEIDKEVGDRSAQLAELTSRLEDPKKGMGAAKEALEKLSAEIPVTQTAIENDVQKTRDQQARYEGLIKQATMGRTLACLQRSTPGYICVKAGSKSKKYPSGNVSPLDYIGCIYAQKANKVVGGNVVTNESLEDNRIGEVKSTVEGLSMSRLTDIPAFDDKTGYTAAMKSFKINTPAQLISALSGVTTAADKATGKSVTNQLTSDVNRCYNESVKQTEDDRKDANTNIGVGKTLMAQMAKTQSSQYASQMRKLKQTYETAVKSATGSAKAGQLNTSRCEAETLENQSKCLAAMGALVDAILTGDASNAAAKLTGPAASLTSGQPPIAGFLSELKAPSDKSRQITPMNPARTISNIQCQGLNDCVAKYENLKTELTKVVEERKQKKESMKSDINSRISETAQSIASGKNAQGVPNGSMSLNQVSQGLSARKEQLIQAMKRFKVGGGLDLENEKVGDTDIDEKTGLVKSKSLRDIVLGAIDPKMLANDEKGFGEASKDIQKRDDELEEKQGKLDDYLDAIEARSAECAKDKKVAEMTTAKEYCEKASETLKNCQENSKQDAVEKSAADINAILDKLPASQRASAAIALNKGTDGAAMGLACGQASSEKSEKCKYYDQLVETKFKDLDNMGDKAKGSARKAGVVK